MDPRFTELLQRLQKVREEQGDEAFEKAVREYAEKALESGDNFIPGMAGAVFEQYQQYQEAFQSEKSAKAKEREAQAQQMRNAQPKEVDPAMLRAIQQSLPGLKSQAQFNAFMASFDALRGVMNSIFTGDTKAEKEFLDGLMQSIDAARKMTELTDKLHDVPEASESRLADEFKNPPRQFGEYDLQRALMTELAGIGTAADLQRWWAENRKRIDDVVSPSLRNPLIDAVRDKKSKLTS